MFSSLLSELVLELCSLVGKPSLSSRDRQARHFRYQVKHYMYIHIFTHMYTRCGPLCRWLPLQIMFGREHRLPNYVFVVWLVQRYLFWSISEVGMLVCSGPWTFVVSPVMFMWHMAPIPAQGVVICYSEPHGPSWIICGTRNTIRCVTQNDKYYIVVYRLPGGCQEAPSSP